ncbi:MAG: hypothetical protein ACRCZF_25370, partial [Gemmataceae bacterium]
MSINTPRSTILGTLMLALTVGVAATTLPGPPPTINNSPATAEQIHKDLQLRLTRSFDGPAFAGRYEGMELRLDNNSWTQSHRGVHPRGGSWIQIAEPHLSWTATVDRDDGQPQQSLDPKTFYNTDGLCITGESRWLSHVCELPPRHQQKLDYYFPIRLQETGRIRISAKYHYTRDDLHQHKLFHPEQFAFIQPVPPFRLESNAIEFTVSRPLEVQLDILKPL